MGVDFASVFRVLTSLLGGAAAVLFVAAVATFVADGPWDGLLLLSLVTAVVSLGFRLAARGAGGRSTNSVLLVATWVIVLVVGSLLAFVLLFIWAVSDGVD